MEHCESVLTPGMALGILGGGQLGRMLAQAAHRLGYRTHVYTPESDSPAAQVADDATVAAWDDIVALRAFAKKTDVVTLEFENIPLSAARLIAGIKPLYPQPHVLETAQNRIREKTFLTECAIPVAPFCAVYRMDELDAAADRIGFPLVLKTADSGYDGKGQFRAEDLDSLRAAFHQFGETPCVLERFVDLAREISVIAARSRSGETAFYRPVENRHHRHILDVTLAPAQLSPEMEKEAVDITSRIMERLDLCGVLCVEFFQLKDGRLLVNELAPRPHNSGHYTIEAATCSQFEQQARAVCGLPPGETTLTAPAAAMANLLGDLWKYGEPDWNQVDFGSGLFLHLYGKSGAQPGRKMGHITAVADTPQEALERVTRARGKLSPLL